MNRTFVSESDSENIFFLFEKRKENMGYKLRVHQIYKIENEDTWREMQIYVMKDGKEFIQMNADISCLQTSNKIYFQQLAGMQKKLHGKQYNQEITEMQIVFNDVDGHSSLIFTDHCMQFTICDIRNEAVELKIRIELNDVEFMQFKEELIRWMILD